jgi:arylsulfatase A-like enzyme
MRRLSWSNWLTIALWLALGSFNRAFAASHAGQPNVIFIVADDLGYGDLRCYGNPYIDTPVLDQLARSGVRFTDYYTPSPLCAPARAALLTGRYNHRTGAVDVSSNRGIDRIALSEKTFGDYFRHAGYATAMIGKWHSGLYCDDYLPHHRGFDLFYGFANGAHDYWKWQLARNDRTEQNDGRYLSDALNDETIAFMEKNRDRPFAVFLAHHAPHVPFQAPEELVQKYKARAQGRYNDTVATIYAMIEAMDRGLGRVFEALERLGIRERTIVVFTSDNGAQLGPSGEGANERTDRYHGPYRGNKDTVLEEGIRVPAIVAWPGAIPAGRVVATPVHGCDWLPTLFARTGAATPAGAKALDGHDIFPVLRGDPAPGRAPRSLMFQKNRYLPVALSGAAIRRGSWKLFWPGIPETIRKDGPRDNWSYHRGVVLPHWEMPLDPDLPAYGAVKPQTPQLYNLAEDPGENNDLAARHPELVTELSREYEAWFQEVFAEWRMANQEIREHDGKYWASRPIPDPRPLIGDFWLKSNRGADSSQDPLRLLTGYWSYEWYRDRVKGAKSSQKP